MKQTLIAGLFASLTFAAGSAHAIGVPSFAAFGPFAEPTFGGSGINGPSINIATSTVTVGADAITLGLAATQRYGAAPAVTDDGNGTYSATAGFVVPPSGSTIPGALWNFDYYIDIAGGGELTDYAFSLTYDFDPAAAISASGLGTLSGNALAFLAEDTNAAGVINPGTTRTEGSQNLAFGFLSSSVSGFIAAPTNTFDPFAEGLYSFELSVFGLGETTALNSVAINVGVTAAAVPLPAGLPLLVAGLGGFAVLRRRKSK